METVVSLSLRALCLVVALILLPEISRPSTSASLRSPATSGTSDNNRWQNPCGGGQPAAAYRSDTPVSTSEVSAKLEDLESRARRLKQKVTALKADYKQRRFQTSGDIEILTIEGAPVWNSSDNDVNAILKLCYENLARLARFTKFVKDGEIVATEDNHNFTVDFLDVEDHHKGGLYPIMCELYTVMSHYLSIRPMDQETQQRVANIPVFQTNTTRAFRHLRDFTVITHLDTSASHLETNFRSAAQSFASRTP